LLRVFSKDAGKRSWIKLDIDLNPIQMNCFARIVFILIQFTKSSAKRLLCEYVQKTKTRKFFLFFSLEKIHKFL